jgi:Tfp pilus assembly protein PilF
MAVVAGWLGWRLLKADYHPNHEAGRLFELAQGAMAEAAPLRSTRLLEQAVASDPKFIVARALLAASYAEVDHPEKARDAVLEATAAADRRWSLGRAERLALNAARASVVRDHKGAAEQYRLLAASVAGRARTYARVMAARAMDQAGDREGALRMVESAVLEDPGNPAARVRLGLLLSRARQQKRASEQFRLAETALERGGTSRVCRTCCCLAHQRGWEVPKRTAATWSVCSH